MANPATPSSDPYVNPLYLHAADNSGVNLVLDKLTGESNYHTWRRSLIKALNSKNKLGFIYGTIVRPPETHSDYGSWTRCNDMVCTWITNSVSKDIGSGTVYFDDAHLLWLNLEGRFRQCNLSKIYTVQDQLDRLHQGSLDLSAYYTRLTTLWEELKNFEELPSCTCGKCTCGSNDRWIQLYERRNIVRFLMRLNESFTQARRQILMMDPLPEFTKIYNFISQDEQQRVLTSAPVPDNPVFQASMAYQRPKGFQQGRPRPLCTHCGLLGHTIARCYKLHGYPPGYKIPPAPGTSVDNSKGKFTPQNGVHMVYSQSPEQAFYPSAQYSQIQPQIPQNNIISYNGASYVPIASVGQSSGAIPTAPIASVGQSSLCGGESSTVNHSINMVNSGKSFVVGNSSNGGEQISQLVTQLNRQLQGSPYQVIRSTPVSQHIGSISAQGMPIVPSHFISAFEPGLIVPQNTWILDTGASCHICCDLSMFSNVFLVEHTTITLPNNTIIPITQAGTVKLSDRLILHPVFYVPSFHFNLISAWTIGSGDQSNDLYLLNQQDPPDTQQHHLAFITVSPELWHQRLGFRYFLTIVDDCTRNTWIYLNLNIVSRSSAEAEYRSMANATCELIWLNSMLEDLHVPLADTIVLYCDNEAALHIAKNSVYHERTKHFQRDIHVVRERVAMGFLKTLHINTEHQLADVLTKPLTALQFNYLLSKMGLHHLYSPS
ncbi:Retrotransposon gag domain [Arabidopsis thaliana x Arabidopsis arenosa]|uniref:Retrotransposon gag domain n=1 Tax=Arabidopsis thaliana x Arabidopsis arenosa TaxID=1240361 RepID=A0A8T2A6K8_9BRAS|nr:Retrotransposon gag domain [Arabidopsis thaliana x Arabidopsis arenosa]